MPAYALLLFKAKVFYFGAACTIPGSGFFGFPHWWEYLATQTDPLGKCSPNFNFPDGILLVGLAIVDILLRLAGLAAVVSIIVAGISFVTSAGSVEKATNARKRIINSIVGLAIALIATAVVTFIGESLK